MPTITIPNRPSGASPRAVADILADFDAILTVVNGQLDKDNVATSLMNLLVPVGTIHPYAGAASPTGFLLCDGAAISRATYATLFAAISTSYGVGDGSTTFNVPDLRGRAPVGVDGAAGRLAANDALGNAAGEETHLLTGAESGMNGNSQTTPISASAPLGLGGIYFNAANIPGGGVSYGYSANGTATQQGIARNADNAHNNMQPYQIVNYIIRTGNNA